MAVPVAPRTVVVVQQQQRQARAPFTPAELAAFGGALFLALGQFIAFINAYDALNQSSPRVEESRAWLLGALVAGIAAVAFVAWAAYQRHAHPALAAAGGGLGLLFGVSFPPELSFGWLAGLGWLILEMILLALLLIPLIVFLVMVFGPHQRAAWGLGTGIVLLHVLSYSVLVAFMLANLDALAAEAEQANEAPTAAGPLVLLLLGGCAGAWRRTRARHRRPSRPARIISVRIQFVDSRTPAPQRSRAHQPRPYAWARSRPGAARA